MNTPNSATPPPPANPSPAPAVARQKNIALYMVAGLLALVVLIVATAALALWWIQRPIKPVVLSAQEKTVVERKLQRLGVAEAAEPKPHTPTAASPTRAHAAEAEERTPKAPSATGAGQDQDRPYVPGSKVLRLTEREINGLLNANTGLGETVRIEFGRDAVNAYIAVPIPQDFPVGGGKMFRARGRFHVSLGNGGAPFAVLEDVTVFGLSLPKAWLGGLKGENLFGEAMGKKDGGPVFRGIKSLRVEPGALVLEVND